MNISKEDNDRHLSVIAQNLMSRANKGGKTALNDLIQILSDAVIDMESSDCEDLKQKIIQLNKGGRLHRDAVAVLNAAFYKFCGLTIFTYGRPVIELPNSASKMQSELNDIVSDLKRATQMLQAHLR